MTSLVNDTCAASIKLRILKHRCMKKFSSALLYLVVITITAAAAVLLTSPPNAVDRNAPADVFSAHRAFDHIRQIARSPHSIGTEAHAQVREYILGECEKLGLKPEVQHTTAVRRFDEIVLAGNVHNIVVPIPGTEGKEAVVLMAHYDSQPNTHGAADNASGVATLLETARILKAGPRQKNDIVLLFTDGEEVNLLGAHAFVSESSWIKNTALVINLEARGNSGASMMFETNPGNGWVIREYAKGAAYPLANALSFEVYKLLPNDTDYTPFKHAGITGLNNAFVDGFVNYHNMNDKLENLNLNSVQHHGENMLSLAQHFGNIDLAETKDNDLSYFNVVGFSFIWYPAGWNLIFTAVITLLLAALIITGMIKKTMNRKGIITGLVLFPATIIVAAVVTLAFLKAIKWQYPVFNNFYFANPYNVKYYFVAILALQIFTISMLLWWPARKFGAMSMMAGGSAAVLLLLVLFNVYIPTAAYILVFPLLFMLAGLTIVQWRQPGQDTRQKYYRIIVCVAAIPALLLLSPVLRDFFIAFGLSDYTTATIVITGLLVYALLPLIFIVLEKRPGLFAAIISTACLLFLALGHFTSSFSSETPLPTSVKYELNASAGVANWVSNSGRVDAGNAGFLSEAKSDTLFPWRLVSTAPVLPYPSPDLTIEHDTTVSATRIIKLHCLNHRKASAVIVDFPITGNIRKIVVDGKEIVQDNNAPPILRLDYSGFPAEGFYFTVEAAPGPIECLLEDITIGIPRDAGLSYPAGVIPATGYGNNTVSVRKRVVL